MRAIKSTVRHPNRQRNVPTDSHKVGNIKVRVAYISAFANEEIAFFAAEEQGLGSRHGDNQGKEREKEILGCSMQVMVSCKKDKRGVLG